MFVIYRIFSNNCCEHASGSLGRNTFTTQMDEKMKQDIQQQIQKIYDSAFRTRLRDGSYEKWYWYSGPMIRSHGLSVRDFIECCLLKGYRVRAGWTATGVRGFHVHWVIIDTLIPCDQKLSLVAERLLAKWKPLLDQPTTVSTCMIIESQEKFLKTP